MKVHLYSICWNEADILPFFFRHYDSWVDRYVIHDDGSTDGSLQALRSHPRVEVRKFERTDPQSFVLSHQRFHNEVWKESRGNADWVIITALDELLQAKNWDNHGYLESCARRQVTLIPAIGFQMISEEFPGTSERLVETRTFGAPVSNMNKLSIFNPDAISDPRFQVGRHTANPIGDLRLAEHDEMMLLHYKYMNFDRTLARHRELDCRLGEVDRKKRLGYHYQWTADQLRADWKAYRAKAIDVGAANFKPGLVMPSSDRWWRKTRSEDRLTVRPTFARF